MSVETPGLRPLPDVRGDGVHRLHDAHHLDGHRRYDVHRVLRAGPLLAQFNVAGILTAADVHVAQRLGRLTGEADERVLLATALAVRAVRTGSVCVELTDAASLPVAEPDDDTADLGELPDALGEAPEPHDLPWPDVDAWRTAIDASPLVAVGAEGDSSRPVRWVDGRLYLDRYWRHEQLVRAEVDARLDAPAATVDPVVLREAVHRLFPRLEDDRQRLAAATAALSRITVLTGGPGTGKTTTVARVLAVLQQVAGPGLRVALAAPTGKAAARLQEAARAEVARLAESDAARVGLLEATTIHRLLGWRPGTSTRFRHDRSHRLPHDVVIIDETSMVSLPLMARLLEALRPEARLVLVGDPDQLASVEAGAVLGDLVARAPVAGQLPRLLATHLPAGLPTAESDLRSLSNGVVRLERVHRYGTELAALADALRGGHVDDVLTLLRAGGAGIEYVETTDPTMADGIVGVRHDVVAAGRALVAAAAAGDARGALASLELHRLLLAHRRGNAGVARWAALAEAWVAAATDVDVTSAWPVGRPLLVTTNDRDTGLSNGDTGVIVSDLQGGVVVAFGDADAPRLIRPNRLPTAQPVHAMTIHRGQGSQFRRVSVVLPPASSPLLTRELLYTAVTRAQEFVRIVGTEAAVRAAVGRPIRRASGLRHTLTG